MNTDLLLNSVIELEKSIFASSLSIMNDSATITQSCQEVVRITLASTAAKEFRIIIDSNKLQTKTSVYKGADIFWFLRVFW